MKNVPKTTAPGGAGNPEAGRACRRGGLWLLLMAFSLLGTAEGGYALGNREKNALAQGDASERAEQEFPQGKITVAGRVRLVGSAAFPRLALTDSEGRDWYIEKQDRAKLAAYEQQTLTVEGTAVYEDIILANGKKAGVQRTLRNIVLLE